MLNIPRALNAGQVKDYHKKEFTSPDQNYWQKGDVTLGEWKGALAEKFGLSGPVAADHFGRLADGQHPHTGEQLIKHREVAAYTNQQGREVQPVAHRAAWDATFSAPKSVSLTALVGGDDRVRLAHREAVSYAVAQLERYTQARLGGNHAAETTGKFVAATFEHDVARPVDGYAAPQLHTHVVIFNMTETEAGKTRALQSKAFFDSQNFATAVYQSELFFRLRQLGYEIERGRSGAPEIKGYSAEYIEASSLRSKQIRDRMEAEGLQGPAAAQIAAHDTRDGKLQQTTEEAMAAHVRLAHEHGDQPNAVIAAAATRHLQQQAPQVSTPDIRAHEAVTYAKEHGFEREAVSDERLLLRDALRRGMGELRYEQVRPVFDARVASGEFSQVPPTKHATGRQFTTPETMAMERSAVRSLRLGQDQAGPILASTAAEKLAASHKHLNEGQRTAIVAVLTAPDRVQGLQGLAGTGKTTTLAVIRAGAERSGYAVEGFAPTSKAAHELREAGVSATTLQKFLRQGQTGPADPASRHLYLLDESSLASTRQMRDFLAKIGPQDRVLVIGDTRQHQGVDAGKPFEQMQDAGMRTARLDRIVRQKDPALLSAVEALARSETRAGIELLQQQGRVTQIPDRQERIAAIAQAYAERPEGTIIVSPDNASRREINRAVRVQLQQGGALCREDRVLPTLIPRSELTGADRRWAAQYHPGDVLHYSSGSKELGVKSDSYATVIAVDQERNRITVSSSGKRISYDPRRLQGISAYQQIDRDFARGERIQFTAPVKDLRVANRQLATITGIRGTQVTAQLDGQDREVSFDAGRMRHFDHGYAVTSHSSQGVTAERVLVNMDTRANPGLVNTRFAYVSVSRASQEAQLFTNDAADLVESLSRAASKTSAITFRQERESPSLCDAHYARSHGAELST